MNKAILLGRLVKDPEIRYIQSGKAVCQFTLAVNKNLSKQKRQELESQNRPTADFPRIIVWGVQAENVSKYLSKGSQCAVEGSIQTGSYQDKDGKTVYTTDVIASNIEYLSNASQKGGYNESNYNSSTNTHPNNQNANRGNYGTNNDNDFFDDDFEEIQDDGRIPF